MFDDYDWQFKTDDSKELASKIYTELCGKDYFTTNFDQCLFVPPLDAEDKK